ncbi:MAG: TlpA family protein disulfide reductase [Solirubrobacteraceae bacterium]
MSRRLRLFCLVAIAAAAIAALAVFGLASSKTASTGRAAPKLPTERLAGAPVTIPGLIASTGGRPFVVVFWASWCGPCAHEAPALERFSQSPAGRGRIVAVDWSDARSGASSFIRSYHWSFPVLRDSEGTVGNAYGLTVLPTTFVLDGQGRVRATLRGPQTEASLEQALTSLEAH